jgi:hypothetical protein
MRTGHRSTTLEAARGALGEHPLDFLAEDAALDVPGDTVVGAEPVAEALRELTSGVDAINIEADGDSAFATWPVHASSGRPFIVCRLEIEEGRVTAVHARQHQRS